MTSLKILLLIIFLSNGTFSFSQFKIDSLLGKIDPQKWAASIEKRASKLEDKIIAKSQKTLRKLQKQEEKIYRRLLATKDSLQAKAALADIKNKYAALQDKLKNPAIAGGTKQYVAKLDTITTALKFLDRNGVAGNIKDALAKTENLQSRLQQAEEIKNFIGQRRLQLKEQLEKLGLTKQLKKINKEIFYYSAQIREYGEILKCSRKTERKALELLSRTKIFKDFMKKNSALASLFRLPGNPDDPLAQSNLAGLQTRAQVNNLIQQQIASGGPNAQQQFQQNMQQAQNQINQLKDKITRLGGGSSDDIMPDGFKANPEKTKSLLKRLEYSVNMQSQKATNLFPARSDLGLSVGYRLSQNKIVGIGLAYSLGLGRGWNHIRFTNEGVGLRTYADIKIKGSLWITGGYEQNYKTAFSDFTQLKDRNAWQKSGLLGFSKVIDVRSKLFKKTKLQLLWDFLSYQQMPRTQPIVLRIGYNLNN